MIGGNREIIMPGLVRHALMRIDSAAKSAASAIVLRYDCGLVKRPLDGFPVHLTSSVMDDMGRFLDVVLVSLHGTETLIFAISLPDEEVHHSRLSLGRTQMPYEHTVCMENNLSMPCLVPHRF